LIHFYKRSEKMLGGNEFLFVLASGFTSAWLLTNGWTICGLIMFIAFLSKFRDLQGSQKLDVPKDFHVVVIGSGVSGIHIGRKLNEIGVKYTILEKSSDLGGTWYDNFYPGVACDVPSHLYSFSDFMNPTWSRAYSKGKEIHEYLKSMASSFGVYPHVVFNKRVDSCTWNQKTCRWTVATTDGNQYIANFVITGSGALHVPKQVDFQGKDTFKGPNFHTALWDKTFCPKGKRIALVGTGASAVQAVPGLVELGCSELKVFQRTPGWVPPRLDYEYPEYVKTMFKIFPFTNTLHRWFFFWRGELRFRLIFTEDAWLTRKLSGLIHNQVRAYYKHAIKDKELCKKLTPNFSMGCKRITPSDTYLQAFNQEHVHLITDKIEEITETGIKAADGVHHQVDAIIYATGFDLQKSARPFTQIGVDGKDMSDTWGDTPGAYLGIAHEQNPNYFMLLGPGTGLGHNSIIYMIECQATYTVDAIKKFVKSGARSMAVKSSVQQEYLDWTQENMKGKVFATNSACTGWYRNDRGINWTLWPLDLVTYWWMTLTCNIKEYDLKY
jgi:cation diffusion facilitator CzcD-associated flavoprotein CzcO